MSFGNKLAKGIWEKNSSKSLPKKLWIRAKALLTIMHNTSTIEDLRIKGQPPNIRLHKLKGDRKQDMIKNNNPLHPGQVLDEV